MKTSEVVKALYEIPEHLQDRLWMTWEEIEAIPNTPPKGEGVFILLVPWILGRVLLYLVERKYNQNAQTWLDCEMMKIEYKPIHHAEELRRKK